MKMFIAAAALAVVSIPAFAQQPAPTSAGSARIYTEMPDGTTVTNFYKQNVYDPSDNKIGDVDDVLIDKEGHVKPGTSCQCWQPLVIVEHYRPPPDVACYEDGLRIVGGVPVIREMAR